MATISLARAWHFTFDRQPDDDWPDQKREYGGLVFRPDKLAVTISHDDAQGICTGSPELSGPRVLKEGLSSNRLSNHLWTHATPDWPDYVTFLVMAAEKLVREEV